MKRYSWQPPNAAIPTAPGVYRFLADSENSDSVLYVGKAKNLRARLTSYFQELSQLEPRTATMMQQASHLIWTVVNTEAEALQLEHSLINEYKPKYNIRFRDDKSYPYLCITAKDDFPRLFSTRRKTIPGARYFGPYPNPSDVRFAIDSLLKIYPIRSCSNGVFRNHQKQGRACLLGHIGKCSAPCTQAISKENHLQVVDQLTGFLSGGHGDLMQSLDSRMAKASSEQRFEDAAKLRDQRLAVESILQKSAVSIERNLSADFVGIVSSELSSVISLVQVRNGRVIGEQRFHADIYSEMSNFDILSEFVLTRYADGSSDINEIFISGVEADLTELSAALNRISGLPYRLHIPLRGEKLRIASLTLDNAKSAIEFQSKSVLADLNSRSQALQDLATELNLPIPPLRIECVDVSHLQGTNRVGAVVVFEDGLPARNEYRSYVLQTPGDDLAGIREIITRRIPRFLETGSRYPVGLLVIDGGPWQAQAAAEILQSHGINIPTVGLAKRLEEVWLPAGKTPIMLPRNSGALYLLQQLRDETHRRAIRHHRNRRSNASVQSVLDEIEGIGPQKRKLLLKTFGGARGLRSAVISDIAALPGIGEVLANKIHEKLHAEELNLAESEPSKVPK
jgi:excinuclease ABC subunit C